MKNLKDGVHGFKRLKLSSKWFRFLVTACKIAQADISQQHLRRKIQSSVPLGRFWLEGKLSLHGLSSNLSVDDPSAV